MIKAIVFDLDGTLVDCTDLHYEALNKAISEVCGPDCIIDYEDHLARFNGLPTKKKLAILAAEYNLDLEYYDQISELKQKYTAELIEKTIFSTDYEMQVESLNTLYFDYGYKLGVASNAINKTVGTILKAAGYPIEIFDIILSNEDVGRPKPDPEIYQMACRLLGLKPEEVAAVEDSDVGIRAGIDAGCKVIDVRNPGDVYLQNILSKIQ